MDDRRDAGPARLLRQPHLGIATAALAAVALVTVRVVDVRVVALWEPSVAWGWKAIVLIGIALVLASSVYLATRFPVHLRYQVKIEMGTVPLYLIAVLLPPPLAALAAGVGEAACGWVLRRQRGHHPGDIATQAGRWALIDLAGSLLVHTQQPAPAARYIGVLVLAAGVLLAGDILTAAVQVSAINGEPVARLIPELARGAVWLEAAQYLLGLTGAILAIGNRAEVFLLIVPVTFTYHLAKRAKELREQTREQLERLADKVDGRDPFTHEHSQRVTEWTRALMRELNVHGPEAYLVVTAARLHDIGKFSISAAILHKHEQLSPEEWRQMERHPEIGANMLSRYPAFARGAAAVRGHHERWDGRGYPDGLAGTDIPFGARVIAVADSFDAMISDRPYRTGMPVPRAAALLAEGKGRQWDPRVVDAFLRQLEAQEEKAPTPVKLAALPTV